MARRAVAGRGKPVAKLLILGAGSFAEDVADLVSEAGRHQLVGFVEGIDRGRCGRKLAGLEILWIDDVAGLADSCRALCAVGSPRRSALVARAHALGLEFTTFVHPAARVSPGAQLGAGTIVSAGVVVSAQTQVGEHVILNRGALVGHHVRIGDFATLAPGANVGGHARIGERATLAMGSVVLDRVGVGTASVVGAGAVVTRDVPDRVQVLGVPARVTRELGPEDGAG